MTIFVTAKNGMRINLGHIESGRWQRDEWVGKLSDGTGVVFEDDPTYEGGYGISDHRKAVLFCDDCGEVLEMRLTLIGWHIADKREFVVPIFADGTTYQTSTNHLLLAIELEGEWYSPESMDYFSSFEAAQNEANKRLVKPK